MGVLWVARHGETDWNRDRRIQGHLDPGLNAVGQDQARELAAKLAVELEDVEPLPPLICSDLLRARQTAEAIAEALGIQPRLDPELRERMLGALQGKTFAELAEEHPDEVAAYRSGENKDLIPGIELTADFRQRVLKATRAAASAHDLAILVTHGGVLRVLLETALGAEKRFMISNASLYRFYVNADQVRRIG